MFLTRFLRYWLPVLLWVFLIFGASTGVGSAQRTSRIIGPLLLWLFPDMPHETRIIIHVAIRKCAHVVEYAVLSFLIWRGLFQPLRGNPKPWAWPLAGWAVLICAILASLDEFSQSFWDSRLGTPYDVVIDTIGASLGIICVWSIGRIRKRW